MARNCGRFDPGPVLRHLELSVPPPAGKFNEAGNRTSLRLDARPIDRDIAVVIGVTTRTIQRWRHGALLTISQADRIACRLGLHPALLWSEWYSE